TQAPESVRTSVLTERENMKEATKPTHEIRLSAVKGTIWLNQGETGTWYGVAFTRLYKDEQGEWKQTTTFGYDDLLDLMKVANEVHSWIWRQELAKRSARAEVNRANQNAQELAEK